jgi:hypothetical protein
MEWKATALLRGPFCAGLYIPASLVPPSLLHARALCTVQNEPSPLAVSTLVEKATRKLVEEFRYMRCQASEPLATFLDYLTYGYMIDNVVLIVTGTLHERDVQVRREQAVLSCGLWLLVYRARE